MDRGGNGTAAADEEDGPLANQHATATNAELLANGSTAVDMSDLSQRVLAAEDRLLAYVDDLEDEVRRLRRALGRDASGVPTDNAG